jgi:hypothetical protein
VPSALTDGWGDPLSRLRDAEEWRGRPAAADRRVDRAHLVAYARQHLSGV